jgi:hypothetical protein
LSTPYNFGQSSQKIQRGVCRTLPGSQLIQRNDARGGFGYFESSQCGATEEWRAIPEETGHYWEEADDTIGRLPLFLIVFSFFPLGKLPLVIRNLMNKIQPGL